jgi:hypothetical protein
MTTSCVIDCALAWRGQMLSASNTSSNACMHVLRGWSCPIGRMIFFPGSSSDICAEAGSRSNAGQALSEAAHRYPSSSLTSTAFPTPRGIATNATLLTISDLPKLEATPGRERPTLERLSLHET